MIAAVALVGRPSVSSGIIAPPAAALFAASGPATPSMAPLPNSSLWRERRRSTLYDRKVGISAPPAGRLPMVNPSADPRSHGRHERAQSSAVIHTRPPTAEISSRLRLSVEATQNTSPTANRPTARF